MAPRNLVSKRRRPPPKDEPRTQLSKQSDELTDSDSDGEAAPLVPPKKPRFASPLKLPGTEPVESGSACSSPSISGFIIAPRAEETMKGKGGAEAKTKSKSKLKSKGKGGSSSKGKVFSKDDVISLLKGLAVFWASGRNNKWAEFHLFISDDLGNQFTRTQVSEKIRTLKNKFDRNLERARANGGRLDLSDPHELTVFELSKALWGDEKAEKGENVDEDEQEKGENGDGDEQEKVENGDGDEQEKVENGDEDEQEKVENGDEEQVDVERDEGRKKKRKKRKQVSENGKSEKPELRVEELVEEGDLRDAANTILSISNLVFENGEGIKKSKKKKKKKKRSKESEELDERKESVKEDVQVEANDEGNKTSSKEEQVDRGSEGNKKKSKKKKKKTKLVNECLEENKSIGEQKEVDELAEKSMKQVDEEEEELSKEGTQVDELAEKSMKQVDEEEELSKEGKEVDEHEKHEKRPKKKKRIDGRDKKKGIAEPVDGHGEENSEPAKEKQETAIGFNEFRSAYPLLYASFNTPGYPMVTMDQCVGIGRETAQELEEKLREIRIQTHRLELRKLKLMSRQ